MLFSEKYQRLTRLHRVEQNPGIMKNGRVKSDNLETGAISIYGLDVETIGIMLDGCFRQECTLNVDTNVYMFLSNIELDKMNEETDVGAGLMMIEDEQMTEKEDGQGKV